MAALWLLALLLALLSLVELLTVTVVGMLVLTMPPSAAGHESRSTNLTFEGRLLAREKGPQKQPTDGLIVSRAN